MFEAYLRRFCHKVHALCSKFIQSVQNFLVICSVTGEKELF